MVEHDYVGDWAIYLQQNKGLSGRTVAAYRRTLGSLASYLQSQGLGLEQASSKHLENYTGSELHKRKLAISTRKPVIAAIRGFFRWLHGNGVISADPSINLFYPKAASPLPVMISREYARDMLQGIERDTLQGARDAAIMGLFLGSGLRVSGLVGLDQSSIQYQQVGKEKRMFIRLREKNQAERVVPVPALAEQILMQYLKHPELQEIDRVLPDGDQVLFVSTGNRMVAPEEYRGEDRRLSARSVELMIKRRGKQAGIPDNQLKPHAMRHLYGSELIEGGADLRQVQLLLGHKDIKTTAVYVHLAARGLVELVDKASPLAAFGGDMPSRK